jgi:hypothetical protein
VHRKAIQSVGALSTSKKVTFELETWESQISYRDPGPPSEYQVSLLLEDEREEALLRLLHGRYAEPSALYCVVTQ